MLRNVEPGTAGQTLEATHELVVAAHERAIAAFGSSLATEEWSVRSNELSTEMRKCRLEAFRLREAALHIDRDHARLEAQWREHNEARFA